MPEPSRPGCRWTGRRCRRDARRPWLSPAPADPRGSPAEPTRERSVLAPGRLRGHERGVLVDLALLRGAAGRTEVLEELVVRVRVVLPRVGHVVLVEDRLDRADRLARTAVHTLIGVDVEHPVALVDAVDGALFDAGTVDDVDARLRDDVGHGRSLRGLRVERLLLVSAS